jgi:hypothetical protein
MTPKPVGFRALGVKHPKDLLTGVKNGYESKLNHFINQSKLLPFDANT